MFQLKIELKRVQTFIFEVPRLKAMLGANALIGQTMRHELPTLLGDRGKGLKWPASVTLATTPVDPLGKVAEDDRDDPAALYQKGILARDGGHFIAVFEDEPAAEAFRSEVEARLAELLPGVLFDAEIKPFPEDRNQEQRFVAREPRETHLLDLPVLQVCQETGQEPASLSFTEHTGEKREKRWRARSVTHRMAWGRRFHYGRTHDIIGLLRDELYPQSAGTRPDDLAQLAAGGYLALLHADGNGIGKRYDEWKKNPPAALDDLGKEARGEAYFHSMRVAVRRALVDALNKTFTDVKGTRHYEVLMLGGDDLLMVCRADKALKFAHNYVAELEQYKLADGEPLHVAIGVAIAKKTYPLHRLNELAESLASSAKRLYRARAQALPNDKKTSVIDWQVVTQSWFEGVAEARRQSERLTYTVNGKPETLLLTGRPYRVSGDDGLEGLLKAASELKAEGDEKAARSPLRSLRTACERGRLSGEMAFARLPDSVRAPLAWGNGELWHPINANDNRTFHLTRALDIIGIREIGSLGRKQP